jgi:hypothetical protein
MLKDREGDGYANGTGSGIHPMTLVLPANLKYVKRNPVKHNIAVYQVCL